LQSAQLPCLLLLPPPPLLPLPWRLGGQATGALLLLLGAWPLLPLLLLQLPRQPEDQAAVCCLRPQLEVPHHLLLLFLLLLLLWP
jgi:hypothetical protein